MRLFNWLVFSGVCFASFYRFCILFFTRGLLVDSSWFCCVRVIKFPSSQGKKKKCFACMCLFVLYPGWEIKYTFCVWLCRWIWSSQFKKAICVIWEEWSKKWRVSCETHWIRYCGFLCVYFNFTTFLLNSSNYTIFWKGSELLCRVLNFIFIT